MRRAAKIHIDPGMEYKDQFIKHFKDTFQLIFDAIDVPNMSLFNMIGHLNTLKIAIDANLVQIADH